MQTLPNLPASIAHQVFATLCSSLPPPAPNTPEAQAARDELAMAAVAALHPADAFEALLAGQIIAADAHAKDSLRLAVQPGAQPQDVFRCRAQASSMMRQAQGGLRTLLRMQAMREKAEAATHPAAMERAGYWFRDVSVPLPEPSPPPDADEDKFATLTEAEQYAVIYPDRAARIRAHHGLPARPGFGPPDPEIVEALVNGSSPILRALDQRAPATVPS